MWESSSKIYHTSPRRTALNVFQLLISFWYNVNRLIRTSLCTYLTLLRRILHCFGVLFSLPIYFEAMKIYSGAKFLARTCPRSPWLTSCIFYEVMRAHPSTLLRHPAPPLLPLTHLTPPCSPSCTLLHLAPPHAPYSLLLPLTTPQKRGSNGLYNTTISAWGSCFVVITSELFDVSRLA